MVRPEASGALLNCSDGHPIAFGVLRMFGMAADPPAMDGVDGTKFVQLPPKVDIEESALLSLPTPFLPAIKPLV